MNLLNLTYFYIINKWDMSDLNILKKWAIKFMYIPVLIYNILKIGILFLLFPLVLLYVKYEIL
jgi:hypothetical protein